MDNNIQTFKKLISKYGSNSNIITDHIYELFIITCIFFLLNHKLGFIFFIFFCLIYSLYSFNNNYISSNINNINDIYINNPGKIEANFQCRPSTLNNPYANYLYGSSDNPSIKACDDSINVSKSYDFNQYNLYENSINKTIGSDNKAHRDFYTLPVSTYPNNNIAFANFLKNNNKSCKENGRCLLYNDIRYQSK